MLARAGHPPRGARAALRRPTGGLDVGIGIATGPAYVGSIQAVDRAIWSALGNTTNLAARLQALTRDHDASIALDEATHRAAGAAATPFHSMGIAADPRPAPDRGLHARTLGGSMRLAAPVVLGSAGLRTDSSPPAGEPRRRPAGRRGRVIAGSLAPGRVNRHRIYPARGRAADRVAARERGGGVPRPAARRAGAVGRQPRRREARRGRRRRRPGLPAAARGPRHGVGLVHGAGHRLRRRELRRQRPHEHLRYRLVLAIERTRRASSSASRGRP